MLLKSRCALQLPLHIWCNAAAMCTLLVPEALTRRILVLLKAKSTAGNPSFNAEDMLNRVTFNALTDDPWVSVPCNLPFTFLLLSFYVPFCFGNFIFNTSYPLIKRALVIF